MTRADTLALLERLSGLCTATEILLEHPRSSAAKELAESNVERTRQLLDRLTSRRQP